MAATNQANEMPFGVALLFALIGGGMLAALSAAVLWPFAWDRLAYVETSATVLQTKPTEKSVKGGTLHGLSAQLDYEVAGRRYLGWVALPKTTRSPHGPEADAVRAQAAVGQKVRCYYDSWSPAEHVRLERPPFEWRMIAAAAVPSLFLLVGLAVVVQDWRKQFPDGFAIAAHEVLSRLPNRFYIAVLGLVALAVGFLSSLGWLTTQLGALMVPVFLGVVVAFIALARFTARAGSVAFPSPEQRAVERATAAPTGKAGHASSQDVPITPMRGGRLAYRLEPDWGSTVGQIGCAGFAAIFLSLVGAVLLLKHGGPLLAPFIGDTSTARGVLAALYFGLISWLASRAIRTAWRHVWSLSVELSEHPLVAGRTVRIIVDHADRAQLAGVSLALVCEESAFPSGVRGGKNSRKQVALKQPIELNVDGSSGFIVNPLTAQVRVPADAPATFATEHEAIDWFIAVALPGRWMGPVRYRVRVTAPAGRLAPETAAPQAMRLDEGPVSIWLDSQGAAIAPGSALRGGYTVRGDDEFERPLRSVELSVLWSEGDAGGEVGVCHYEDYHAVDGDDLKLYGTRQFSTRLPTGEPPSHEGPLVKVRWAVRLRLRYADGTELVRELPFHVAALAPAE